MTMLQNALSQANAGSIYVGEFSLDEGLVTTFVPPNGTAIAFPSSVEGCRIAGVAMPGGQLFAQHGGLCYVRVVPTAPGVGHPPGTHLGAVTGQDAPNANAGECATVAQATAGDYLVVLCCIVQDSPARVLDDTTVLQLVQWLPSLGASVLFTPPP